MLSPARYQPEIVPADENRSQLSIQTHVKGVLSFTLLITAVQPCKDSRAKGAKKEKHPTLLEALLLDTQTFPFTCTCLHIQLLPSHCLQQARPAGRRVWPENSHFQGKQQLANRQNPDFFQGQEKLNNKKCLFSFELNNVDIEDIKELKMAPNSSFTTLKFPSRAKLNKLNVYGLTKILLLQLISTS